MNDYDGVFVKLIKKHIPSINEDFITTFFSKFKIEEELEFNIKDTDVVKYLGIKLTTLKKRLSNSYAIIILKMQILYASKKVQIM